MTDPIKPNSGTWDAVGAAYAAEVAPHEAGLAVEIAERLAQLGIPAGATLLEAGSGSGHLSLVLRQAGYAVSLLDFAPNALRAGRRSFEQAGAEAQFHEGDLLDIPHSFEAGAFDVVWNSGVLEHFDDDALRDALRAMQHAARRAVLFLVPNPDSLLYQTYRLRMVRAGYWNFGVEFLRRDYAAIARAVGFDQVVEFTCGREFTDTTIGMALQADPEACDAVRTLLRADRFFADQLVLRGFACAVDTPLAVPAAATESERPGFAIDRTFYLDALGAANAATTAHRQIADLERANAHAARTRAAELEAALDAERAQLGAARERLDAERDGLAAERRARAELEQALADSEAEYRSRLTEVGAQLETLAHEAAWVGHAAQRVAQSVAAVEFARDLVTESSESLLGRVYRFATILIRMVRRDRLRGLSAAVRALARYARGDATAFGGVLMDDPMLRVCPPLESVRLRLGAVLDPVVDAPTAGDLTLEVATATRRVLRRTTVHAQNRSGRPRVAYFTNQLLDWDDQRPRHGGGERYCLALTELLEELGFEVDLFQLGHETFEGEYRGHRVRAIPLGATKAEFVIGAADTFHDLSADYDHVVYNLPALTAGRLRTDAIAICHGIWFDHDFWPPEYRHRSASWFTLLRRSFANPQRVVSVDTASINFVRSLWPDVAERMHYIPNFVDTAAFAHAAPIHGPEQAVRPLVLIPRRSQANRGSRLLARMLAAIPHDADFYWIGEGDAPDTAMIQDLCRRDSRLHFDSADFDEMPSWYARADIVVVPTVAAEGTSLACLEGMASGCAVVTTHVGGLGNLVQDEVNGLLVEPSAEALAAAVSRLIEDTALRRRLADAGRATAEAFSQTRWRERWRRFLGDLGWLQTERAPAARVPQTRPRIAIVTGAPGPADLPAHAADLAAAVLVAGVRWDRQATSTFAAEAITSYEELLPRLEMVDVVVLHEPVDWAARGARDCGRPVVTGPAETWDAAATAAWRELRVQEPARWTLLAEVVDEGSIHDPADEGCGYVLDAPALDAVRAPPTAFGSVGPLRWTAARPLHYRVPLPAGCTRASVEVRGRASEPVDLPVVLIDGSQRHEHLVHADAETQTLYTTIDRPPEAHTLDVTIQPPAETNFVSEWVRICAWAPA